MKPAIDDGWVHAFVVVASLLEAFEKAWQLGGPAARPIPSPISLGSADAIVPVRPCPTFACFFLLHLQTLLHLGHQGAGREGSRAIMRGLYPRSWAAVARLFHYHSGLTMRSASCRKVHHLDAPPQAL